MTSHAPPIQPAAAPHHVNQGLTLLVIGLVVVPLVLAGLVNGFQIPMPRTESAAAEFLISHRASERATSYAPIPTFAFPKPYVPSPYYSVASTGSGVHGPYAIPCAPSIYYPVSSAGSGVHGRYVIPYAPSIYYPAASARSGVHGPA